MKVLFAVSNDKMSETIVKQYQKDYKQIISYKNVYYFNAILKELQKDKGYDRIVISEDLEQFTNNDYEKMDNFMFSRLDSISDEAININGEDIPIILICTERRSKSEPILVKLFGIGIYNAIIGNDRSVNEVCRLINRPRSKKEAKSYYKIDSEKTGYIPPNENENEVSELELQNILAHYKRLGSNEQKIVESFESIASQYNEMQLRLISKILPLNVRAVLEASSTTYQQVNSYNNKIVDSVRVGKKKETKKGTSEILLKGVNNSSINEPVVVPSSIDTSKKKKVVTNETKKIEPKEESNIKLSEIEEIEEPEVLIDPIEQTVEEPVVEEPKRKRGRPRKIVEEPVVEAPKRKRGRPRKNPEPEEIELPGLDNTEEQMLPGIENNEEEQVLPRLQDTESEENMLPGIDDEIDEQYTNLLKDLERENEEENIIQPINRVEEPQYEELDMNSILSPGQKVIAFVGTSKNGTSFLINNVAELLSANGIDTAILDLTSNRNAYYIYTKNEENLRNKSNRMMQNLIDGTADGIRQNNNLTVYTSVTEQDEIAHVEPIIETLVKNHKIILMDCDFTTPMKYFKYAQEIYLVQSMDILTIQPLTAFLNQLSYKGMFEESKVRVILNKFMKTRELNEEILIGGISIYNDASMTVRRELFNRRTVKYITIPFELKTYLRYLDGLVTCDVSLRGYSKEFMQSLKQLGSMIYQGNNTQKKYMPPSVSNMRQNY